MSNCKYCGQPAGLFHDEHAVCEEQFQEHERQIQERERQIEAGRQRITEEVARAIAGSEGLEGLEQKLAHIEQASFVPPSDRRALLVKGWESSVERILEDSILEVAEETRLVEFKEHFALSREELDKNGALTRVVKAGVLRDILNGKIPQRVSLNERLPINFQKSEQIVWAFSGSSYLEDKTRREFVGGSHGVSVRLMQGVYYRVGAFKGHAVEHTERVHVDTGWVAVTNKNVYFAGPRKSLRIPYAKIVSFEPFSNGIGLMRDVATAKPQIFVTGDGWFTYNLATNLARF